MKLKITKGPIEKCIRAPASKSWANRYLILAAIAKKPVTIKNCPESSDVLSMISAFKTIGLIIKKNKSDVTVVNSFPQCEECTKQDVIEINSGDGGTTNRFLLALLSKGRKDYVIRANVDFISRPKKELLDVFTSYGLKLEEGHDDFWFKVFGNYHFNSSEVKVDCSKSTQFISGLMLAYSDSDIKFTPVNLISSKSYFEMTKQAIKDSRAKYNSKEIIFNTPVDFSSLSYPLVFSVGEGEINFPNCFEVDSFQADSFLLKILESKGVGFQYSEKGLFVSFKDFDFQPIELSCGGFPDLVPSLVFLSCLCKGKSTLNDLEVLTFKESDRFSEIIKILKIAGVGHEVDYERHSISLVGPVNHDIIAQFNLPADHRMVMLASMLLKKFGRGEVNQVEHIRKSYPRFFKDFNI